MIITKTLYVKNRSQWRKWLEKNHDKAKEIWLIYYKKHTNKPCIPYNDAVEEALCYGWIDSTVKRVDDERTAQRYTPRRMGSRMSEMNRVRVRRLIMDDKMTSFGMAHVPKDLNRRFVVPKDILSAIKNNKEAYKFFRDLPLEYKRIRIAFIDEARDYPELFKPRLAHFIKMTARNKKFGLVR